MAVVLVTGGSGFIARHCVLRLREQGHQVRVSVRSAARADRVAGVEYVQADLLADEGWAEAVAGCDFVLHVASPVRPGHVADEEELIVPAVRGTLRVLRAARAAGVRRVVLTSAFHAVGFGHPHTDHVFTEDDWSVLDGPGMDAYGRSKVLAERAAWEFAREHPMELVVLLPVAVMGPAFGGRVSGANHIVRRILSGGMRRFPDVHIPVVDVRDVAAAHVAAMTAEGAAGHRFLLAGGQPLAMARIAEILGVPGRRVPDAVVRLAALVRPEFRPVAGELGYVKQISDSRARDVLGWRPRPADQAILAAAASLR